MLLAKTVYILKLPYAPNNIINSMNQKWKINAYNWEEARLAVDLFDSESRKKKRKIIVLQKSHWN